VFKIYLDVTPVDVASRVTVLGLGHKGKTAKLMGMTITRLLLDAQNSGIRQEIIRQCEWILQNAVIVSPSRHWGHE